MKDDEKVIDINKNDVEVIDEKEEKGFVEKVKEKAKKHGKKTAVIAGIIGACLATAIALYYVADKNIKANDVINDVDDDLYHFKEINQE